MKPQEKDLTTEGTEKKIFFKKLCELYGFYKSKRITFKMNSL